MNIVHQKPRIYPWLLVLFFWKERRCENDPGKPEDIEPTEYSQRCCAAFCLFYCQLLSTLLYHAGWFAVFTAEVLLIYHLCDYAGIIAGV